jgi:hypothetical protein
MDTQTTSAISSSSASPITTLVNPIEQQQTLPQSAMFIPQSNYAHHSISLKLTSTSHLYWKTQMKSFLQGRGLFGISDL